MRSQSLAVKYAPLAPQSFDPPPARAALYGGMVGEMLKEIEERMTDSADAMVLAPALPIRVDPIHLLSIAAGYIGLACGFSVVGLLCFGALQSLTG